MALAATLVRIFAADTATQAPAAPPADADVGHVDWNVWRTDRQRHPVELHGGLLFWRRLGAGRAPVVAGWEVGFGSSTLLRVRPFVLFSTSEVTWRTFDSESYALSYAQALSVGLVLGPFEPDVRAGLSMFTIDAFHGNWSAELFSPRVAAGGWLRVGHLGVGAHAFGEYLWRWLGNGDVLDHGVIVSLAIEP